MSKHYDYIAIGGGSEAAYFTGIPTKKYLCATYVVGGALAAVAGPR